jgi:hypothetical protein
VNHLADTLECQEWYIAYMRSLEPLDSRPTPKSGLLEASEAGLFFLDDDPVKAAYLGLTYWILWERMDKEHERNRHLMRPDIRQTMTDVWDQAWGRTIKVISRLVTAEEVEAFEEVFTPTKS